MIQPKSLNESTTVKYNSWQYLLQVSLVIKTHDQSNMIHMIELNTTLKKVRHLLTSYECNL
jgi:hypothetical protein